MDKVTWDFLQLEKPTIFLRDLANHICGGSRHLANRALDLSKVTTFIPGRSPVKLIESNLLRLIISKSCIIFC